MFRTVVLIAALLSAAAPAQAGFFFEGDGIPSRASVSHRHGARACHCVFHHAHRLHRSARCVK